MSGPTAKPFGTSSTKSAVFAVPTSVAATSCDIETITTTDGDYAAVILKRNCPAVAVVKANFLGANGVLAPGWAVEKNALTVWEKLGMGTQKSGGVNYTFSAFAKKLGLPDSMRPFGLSEMLSYTGIHDWIALCREGFSEDRNCAQRLSLKYYEVADASRAYCDQICVPDGASAALPDFTKSYDPPLKDQLLSCIPDCKNGAWNLLMTAKWVQDRGMVLVPTTRRLAPLFDPRMRPSARLNGVLGLRLTIEFDGGRTTTVDVP